MDRVIRYLAVPCFIVAAACTGVGSDAGKPNPANLPLRVISAYRHPLYDDQGNVSGPPAGEASATTNIWYVNCNIGVGFRYTTPAKTWVGYNADSVATNLGTEFFGADATAAPGVYDSYNLENWSFLLTDRQYQRGGISPPPYPYGLGANGWYSASITIIDASGAVQLLGGITHQVNTNAGEVVDTSSNAFVLSPDAPTLGFAHELGHTLSLLDSRVNDGTLMGYPNGPTVTPTQCSQAQDAGDRWQLWNIIS